MSRKGYKRVAGDENVGEEPFHPLSKANIFSAFAFWWMNGVLKTGSQRLLTLFDIFPIHEKYKTQELTEKLQKHWNSDVEKCRRNGKRARLWKKRIEDNTLEGILSSLECFPLLRCRTCYSATFTRNADTSVNG